MNRFKYRRVNPGVEPRRYEVALRETGEVLGTMYRYERGYNLVRYLVVRGWKLAGSKEYEGLYDTRDEAAEALEKRREV